MAFATMPFYNLDGGVGPGLPNNSDDVRLVQTLLIEINNSVNPKFGPATPLKANGTYDQNTAAWILAYQMVVAKKNPGKVSTDGKIHPMPMERKYDVNTSYSGGGIYHIYGMNMVLREKNKAAHQGLAMKLGIKEAPYPSSVKL